MKTNTIILTTVAVASLALITGCNKPAENNSGGDTNAIATNAMGSGVKSAATEVNKAVDATKSAAQTAAQNATTAANSVAADASAKVATLIDQAKTLVGQGKFQDAITALQQLQGLKLTDEQQKVVTSLKEQIQKAITAATTEGAAGAATGLPK